MGDFVGQRWGQRADKRQSGLAEERKPEVPSGGGQSDKAEWGTNCLKGVNCDGRGGGNTEERQQW